MENGAQFECCGECVTFLCIYVECDDSWEVLSIYMPTLYKVIIQLHS